MFSFFSTRNVLRKVPSISLSASMALSSQNISLRYLHQFILVAGQGKDAKDKLAPLRDYRMLCNYRIGELFEKYKNEMSKSGMLFHVYDFQKDTIELYTCPPTVTSLTIDPLTGNPSDSAVTRKDDRAKEVLLREEPPPLPGEVYRHGKIGKTPPPSKVSIVKIYEKIREIGKDKKTQGTLMELSFFSAGSLGGPHLAFTFDEKDRGFNVNRPPLSGFEWYLDYKKIVDPSDRSRMVEDRDPRTSKDFLADTKAEKEDRKNFRAAFNRLDNNGRPHKKVRIWQWGCSPLPFSQETEAEGTLRDLLLKIENNVSYKEKNLNNNTTPFKFPDETGEQALTSKEVQFIQAVLLKYKHIKSYFPDQKNIEITFGQIKAIFSAVICASYAHQIANYANVVTYCALMGMESDFTKGEEKGLMQVITQDEQAKKFSENLSRSFHNKKDLMRVAATEEKGKYFSGHLTFYKKHIGVEHESIRNYGIYLPESMPSKLKRPTPLIAT